MSTKKLILAGGVGIVLIAGAIGGLYLYNESKPKPDEVFYSYVEKYLKDSSLGLVQTATGTGVDMSVNGYVDSKGKKLMMNGAVTCSTKVEGNEIKIKATIQQENEKYYIQLNEISGTYANSDGESFDLKTVWSNAIGKWYLIADSDEAISSQLNSGIAAFNSALLAPSYDTAELANEIVDTKVFSYKSYRVENGKYVFQFVADKNAYTALFKNKLPNVSNVDLIMDNIFGAKSSIDSQLVVSETGDYIEETLPVETGCPEILGVFVAEDIGTFAEEITAISKPSDDVKIEPITESEPLDSLYESMVL